MRVCGFFVACVCACAYASLCVCIHVCVRTSTCMFGVGLWCVFRLPQTCVLFVSGKKCQFIYAYACVCFRTGGWLFIFKLRDLTALYSIRTSNLTCCAKRSLSLSLSLSLYLSHTHTHIHTHKHARTRKHAHTDKCKHTHTHPRTYQHTFLTLTGFA